MREGWGGNERKGRTRLEERRKIGREEDIFNVVCVNIGECIWTLNSLIEWELTPEAAGSRVGLH
jgi:hypothetical protein